MCALVTQPGTPFFDDLLLQREIEQGASRRNSLVVHDIELRFCEGRRDFVLHDFDTGPISCDDTVGCAAVLALLDELCRRKIRKKVMAIFTVAEEAGFQGAKYICMKKRIPKSVNLIAIETSSRLPTANIGDGVVIRVGDRLNIFTPAVTAFMVDIAKDLKSKNKNFKYQRKLMDGGTCESTVYNAFKYTNGAVCIPLGNYHNRNVRTGKIQPEFVSMNDLYNMVQLFIETVRDANKFAKYTIAKLPAYKLQAGNLGEKFFL